MPMLYNQFFRLNWWRRSLNEWASEPQWKHWVWRDMSFHRHHQGNSQTLLLGENVLITLMHNWNIRQLGKISSIVKSIWVLSNLHLISEFAILSWWQSMVRKHGNPTWLFSVEWWPAHRRNYNPLSEFFHLNNSILQSNSCFISDVKSKN